MTVFTDAQAKAQLENVLDEAAANGEVRIRRGDGQEFLVKPLLTPATESPSPVGPRRDLSDLAGTWVPDPAFDQAILDQDRVDPDLWK